MYHAARYREFAALHVPGEPLILYNIWDAGSARAVAAAGAKAIATGSHSVAKAHGYEDGETMPFDLVIANLERIVAAVALPVTLDMEGGYAEAPLGVAANLVRAKDAGAVGCNFEDQVVGGTGLHAIAFQAERITAARAALGAEFFINARTDVFLKAMSEPHTAELVDEAIARAAAYHQAGANSFFAPGLTDQELIARLCESVALPVNIMAFPGVSAAKALASVGVARISHGPGPFRLAMQTLEAAARGVLA